MIRNKQWYCKDSHYCSYRLIFSGERIIVRPSWKRISAFCVYGTSLGFICTLSLCSGFRMPQFDFYLFCGISLLFTCGLMAYLFLRFYPEIDLKKGIFYPYGKKKRIFSKKPQEIQLKDVSAIDLSHHGSFWGKHYFECFTLQLIVPHGRQNYRYMLLNHGDYSTFMLDVEKLSETLELPLPDAGLEDFNGSNIGKYASLALIVYPLVIFIIAKEISFAIRQKDMFLLIVGVLLLLFSVFYLIKIVKAFKRRKN